MGFRLYTKNGIFNPVAYGLRPGSDIFVAAIGGGGGSGRILYSTTSANNYQTQNGGAGGPSSFGGYLTAPGGTGGGADLYRSSNSYSTPSPSSGGLIPELLNILRSPVTLSLSDVFFSGPFISTMLANKPLTSGGTYAFCKDGPGVAGSQYVELPKYITNMDGTTLTVTGVGMIDKGNEIISQRVSVNNGNAYLIKDTGYMRGGPCAVLNVHNRDWVYPTSGIGYGAGGLGFARSISSPSAGNVCAHSGSTPTPIMGFITLETLEEIAVTVGGGGASGGYRQMSGTVSGITTVNSGTAGAAGTRDSSYRYSADGGYGDKAPGDGAGAGGCVAIWW